MNKQQEALKLALGELQAGKVGNAMQILREALAEQPAQYATTIGEGNLSENGFEGKRPKKPAQQKIPSIIQMLGHCPECGAKAHHFTSPPASKPWVSLTDAEVKNCIASTAYSFEAVDIARAIEAKLREKNA
jgi:hypothetical protein